ncbi:hypothetical protein MKW98_001735 [Papaver atlanticum]|uniref:F-box associated beta-propeller type 3 domain-containing protein n=1 Tax=Papaver atlanticum TaxID=357466 RepID=A0AAD4X8T4_9MAGN|nr:hypothetical protein MKW98_001735 [Papaver atlanticum]
MSPQNRLDDNSLEEILINLPVKSLMRFKCSHLSRSKTHPQLLIKTYDDNDSSEIILTPEDGFKGGVALHKVKIPWAKQASMLNQSIDGLFCFVNYSYCLTCIYNLGTRQVTPWAQSCIPIQGDEYVKHKPIYGFGFDPLTNNYKVLRDWEISRHGYEYEEMGRVDHICEVFTVGGNRWRKIDEVPPGRLDRFTGVYANGSIYWRNDEGSFEQQDNEVIVAFGIGTERFRVVEIPNFILAGKKVITGRWTPGLDA